MTLVCEPDSLLIPSSHYLPHPAELIYKQAPDRLTCAIIRSLFAPKSQLKVFLLTVH